MVCVRSLRTQQRAKSQCTCTYPVKGGLAGDGLVSETDAKIVSMAGLASRTRHLHVSSPHGRSSDRPAVAYRHSMESLILAQDERWRRA